MKQLPCARPALSEASSLGSPRLGPQDGKARGHAGKLAGKQIVHRSGAGLAGIRVVGR